MEKMEEDAFHITQVNGRKRWTMHSTWEKMHSTEQKPMDKMTKWEKMHSTLQKSMEKVGEDAFHTSKVHGENGERCIPHIAKSMEKMGEDAFHITKVHG